VQLFHNLFSLPHGKVLFKDEQYPIGEVITLKLSTGNLIYRGVKSIEDFEIIKKNCPPFDSKLYFSSEPMDLFQNIILDRDDKNMLKLIEDERKISDIISMSHLSEAETLKTLYALYCTRMIEDEKGIIDPAFVAEFIEKSETENGSIVADKIQKLYREYKHLGYHGVLDISKRASIDEIKRAYYKMAKEFHPDRHLSFQSDDLKEKLDTVFAYINEAYNVLVEQNQEGREFLKSKNYEQALLLLEQAVQFDESVPEYHYYYGLCLFENTRLKDSQKYLRKALELDPGNSVYTAELGKIYLKIGLKTKARNAFETVLKNDPSNDTAREGLEALSRKPL
jgi:hypothetical protein